MSSTTSVNAVTLASGVVSTLVADLVMDFCTKFANFFPPFPALYAPQ
jgi:hypothetical protein